MAWSTIRLVTKEDYQILNKKAREFATRHGLELKGAPIYSPLEDLEIDIEYMINNGPDRERGRQLRRLWLGVFRRAVNEPDATGIAYGYIGYHVN
jgi:hypothetical protein